MINVANMEKAYSEVYAFLNAIGEEYINKIPSRIYNTIKNKRDLSYQPIYNKNQTMKEDMISKEALALIAGLNLEYWCEDEKQKQELKQCYLNNLKKEQEQYSYENLFKNENVQEKNEITVLVEYQEKNIFKILLNKLRKWLKNRKEEKK